MLYNKNIILDILQREFWEELEALTERCVMKQDAYNLENIFENPVDYALFDSINKMRVMEYDVRNEYENNEEITGVLEIETEIQGYTHWDGEDIRIGNSEISLGIGFYFEAENGIYSNLELEYLY